MATVTRITLQAIYFDPRIFKIGSEIRKLLWLEYFLIAVIEVKLPFYALSAGVTQRKLKMQECIIQAPNKEIATNSCMMFSNHFTENDQINEKHDHYDKFSTCEVTFNIENGGGLFDQ